MKGLILYKRRQKDLTPGAYGVHRMLKAAEQMGIDLRVVAPEQFELVVTRNDRTSILIDGVSEPLPDFMIPRMGCETSDFGLTVIRQLERMGVYCCNSSTSIETVRDKLHVHQILAQSGMPTPKTMMVKFPVDINVVKREIGFPVVVKNIIGTRGEGIYLSESEDRFLDLMELIYSYNNSANIILQEFIAPSKGVDLRVFVVGGQVMGCMRRRAAPGGFKANFSMGGSVEPFALTEEAERLALETARIMGLEIAGIDLLFSEEGLKICEANSSPGFEGLEKVVGNHIAEDILNYISKRCLERRNDVPLCSLPRGEVPAAEIRP